MAISRMNRSPKVDMKPALAARNGRWRRRRACRQRPAPTCPCRRARPLRGITLGCSRHVLGPAPACLGLSMPCRPRPGKPVAALGDHRQRRVQRPFVYLRFMLTRGLRNWISAAKRMSCAKAKPARGQMPASTVIDIHPHIISPDLKRYPRAPLGGKQSDWSATRPVSLEQMIAAMDEAGVAQSPRSCRPRPATATTIPMSPTRWRRIPSASPAYSRPMCSRPMPPKRMRHWVERGLSGMRLFTFG